MDKVVVSIAVILGVIAMILLSTGSKGPVYNIADHPHSMSCFSREAEPNDIVPVETSQVSSGLAITMFRAQNKDQKVKTITRCYFD